MELNDFIKITNRAETVFDKSYNDNQLTIMYEELQNLSKEVYTKAIKHCINTCKTLPKIADIRLFTNESKASSSEENNNTEYVNCKRCNKGFIRYYRTVEDIRYEYVALCNCENGKIRQQQGYNLPVSQNMKAINGETNIDMSKYRNDIKINRSFIKNMEVNT